MPIEETRTYPLERRGEFSARVFEDVGVPADDAGSHTFSVTAQQQGLLLLLVSDTEAQAYGLGLVLVRRKR